MYILGDEKRVDSFIKDLDKNQLEKLKTFISSAGPGGGGTALGVLGLSLKKLPMGGTLLLAILGSGLGGVLSRKINERLNEKYKEAKE